MIKLSGQELSYLATIVAAGFITKVSMIGWEFLLSTSFAIAISLIGLFFHAFRVCAEPVCAVDV